MAGTMGSANSRAGQRKARGLRTAAAIAALGMIWGTVGCSDDDDRAQGTDETDDAGGADDGQPTTTTTSPPPTPSTGCDGPATPEADLVEDTMEIRDVERRYLLSAPAWEEGDEPLPLVLDFHGLAEGADVHAGMTQLGPMGVEEGFVTVFPHGTGDPVRWNVAADPETNDDLAFVESLLDRVEEERCIDVSRVYSTGLSNGAMMTSTVACTMADRVAAVAPVAGITLPEDCEPARPVPVLTFHGTADPILLFNGGVDGAALDAAFEGGSEDTTTTTVAVDLDGEGYPETVRGWADLGGCDETPEDQRVGEEVLHRTYACPEDTAVEFFIIEGGGHSWPASEFSQSIEQIVGHTTFDIDANQEAWEFFQRFHLPPG